MDSDIHKMALGCYGYGRWDAPYWFIGPEQGMKHDKDTHRHVENFRRRVEVWLHLGGKELCDLCDFHVLLPDMRWHGERPKFQKTWKQLMQLLMAFRGKTMDIKKPEDQENLRRYQRDQWGRQNGETCVIELSGLPAKDLKAGKQLAGELFSLEKLAEIRQERIEFIRHKIATHKPELVVMYGYDAQEHFEKIIGSPFPSGGTLQRESSILALATHPVSYEGVENAYWIKLGERLRERRHQLQ